MRTYHISELEQLSGVKAHTIRIWEKRYGLIKPERTDTNIRMYSDDQVRKLLNIASLLSSGIKISKIAALKSNEMNAMINDLKNDPSDQNSSLPFIDDLISSMLDYNEIAFEKAFSAAVTRYGMYKATLMVFYPLLNRIGLMWTMGDAMPIQEHFASAIIRRKLLSSIDGLAFPDKKTKRFLLFLPPGEWHELGLIFSDFVIRSHGFPTVYVGQNTPYENVKKITSDLHFTHVLFFMITRAKPEDLHQIRKKLGLSTDTILLAAGNPSNTDVLEGERNIKILKHPDDLLSLL